MTTTILPSAALAALVLIFDYHPGKAHRPRRVNILYLALWGMATLASLLMGLGADPGLWRIYFD